MSDQINHLDPDAPATDDPLASLESAASGGVGESARWYRRRATDLLAIGLLGFATSRIGAAAELDHGAERSFDYMVTGLVALGLVIAFIPFVPWMQRTIRRWNPGHGPGGGA